MKSLLHSWLTIPVFFFFLPRYASAYTWQFTTQPRQCQNASIAIQGSGQPPYSLLLIPSGPTPLPNNTEVRTIQNISFTGTSTTLSFNPNYPEDSSFVAVVCLIAALPSSSRLAYRTTHRSVTAVGLAPVVPVPRLQSFHHPTPVVLIPPRVSKAPGCLASIPRAVSHNVNRFGCGGNKSSLTGAFTPPQSPFPFWLSPSLTLFSISRHTALSISMALFPGEIPSTSPKVLCPRTMIPALASIGRLTLLAEPICLLSQAMIAESVPGVVPHSRSLTQQTIPV